jgi:hypothetical protein
MQVVRTHAITQVHHPLRQPTYNFKQLKIKWKTAFMEYNFFFLILFLRLLALRPLLAYCASLG